MHHKLNKNDVKYVGEISKKGHTIQWFNESFVLIRSLLNHPNKPVHFAAKHIRESFRREHLIIGSVHSTVNQRAIQWQNADMSHVSSSTGRSYSIWHTCHEPLWDEGAKGMAGVETNSSRLTFFLSLIRSFSAAPVLWVKSYKHLIPGPSVND